MVRQAQSVRAWFSVSFVFRNEVCLVYTLLLLASPLYLKKMNTVLV